MSIATASLVAGGRAMSQKGNNLARRYLFCAAKNAIDPQPSR